MGKQSTLTFFFLEIVYLVKPLMSNNPKLKFVYLVIHVVIQLFINLVITYSTALSICDPIWENQAKRKLH